MLRPLHDYVVLEKIKEEEKTQSGIILTEKPKDQPSKGLVIAVGPGKTEDGKLVPTGLEAGQKVIYKKYSGTEVTEDKKDYLLIKAEDILAVIE
ncbi:MAG: co-chaperone GroES [Erysipelotrichaceae bacterium]|nr:co-chaperone GroES [Erysipelotrichaceae bacterium]